MGKINKPVLTLYSRSYCHLCDDMLTALEALRSQHVFSIEVLDVDAHPDWVARYDQLVPVLTFGSEEICRYFLDTAKVREVLSRFR